MTVQRRRAGTVSKEVYETQAAFRYALRQFLRFSETAARGVGLTPQQYQGLLAIQGFPGRDRVRVGELAERLQIHPHSAVGLADRGLAVRARSNADRRHVFIRLTARGIRVLERVSAANRRELRRLRPQLTGLLGRMMRLEGRGSPTASSRTR
ncbi:MAG: MarR family transcriptional regulator [Gemmatimonadetes bacterium]|nr:MAG: MarR family transcriptional regulator [Gemmatimonadota bacterium]